MKTSKAASCDKVDAASLPEVFELVPDLSQGPGELRLSTHVDREIVFPGHTIGARTDGRLLDAAPSLLEIAPRDPYHDENRPGTTTRPPQVVVVVAADDRRQMIGRAEERERAGFAVIGSIDADLRLLFRWQLLIDPRHCGRHLLPPKAVSQVLREDTANVLPRAAIAEAGKYPIRRSEGLWGQDRHRKRGHEQAIEGKRHNIHALDPAAAHDTLEHDCSRCQQHRIR